MKSIIFCEGKTDAILLSYYLDKVANWKFNSKLTKNIGLPIRNSELEEVNVYTKDGNELIIWAVGGISNLQHAVSNIIEATQILEKENAYRKLVVLMDRDKNDDDSIILDKIKANFDRHDVNFDTLINNQWSNCTYINEYEEENELKLLPVIIPFDKSGALETFLLDAICDFGVEEASIVRKSKEFINGFSLIKYLNSQRLKVKGELAVTLGVMFPQKTFTPIDSMLRNIEWEDYKTIQEGFRKLEEI